MPVYSVQTPKGVVEIEGPPNADQDQIIRLAQQHYATLATADPGNVVGAQSSQGPGGVVSGIAETGATLVTGATSGLLGQVLGTLNGIAKEIVAGEFGSYDAANRISQQATEGAQSLTYAPRTETGQQYVEKIGEVTEPLVALTPMAPELGAIARMSKPLVKGAIDKAVVQPVRQKVAPLVQQVKQQMPTTPTPGTGTSAGAMAVDKSIQRQAAASELPVPIKLTEGQKTRTFEQQRFERETAKLPEAGAPLRERFGQQNQQLIQNMDAFIDQTGSEIVDLRGVGELVDASLRNRAARDKIKIRSLYKEAEKSGEMEDPVKLDNIAQHLVESAPEAEVANVLKAVKAKAIQLGVITEGPNGELIAKPAPLKNIELLRRSINNATNAEPTNIRQASIMKQLIDEATEGSGGDLYKKARAARKKYGDDYERIGVVKNLLGLKRGTEDRAIALEDVLRKSVLEPSASLDSVRQVRRLLQTSGDDGKQAWKELQGGTLRYIQEQMTKGVGRDQSGNPIVSPAQLDRVITQLDKTGKLDFVFGVRGAEQLRLINDVAKDVLTSPPGVVNNSNTATVLAGLMDVALTSTTGVPAPLASSVRFIASQIKDTKLKAKVKKSLGEDK